jgi:CubicO group peptidase (beta-lactamase class C family)
VQGGRLLLDDDVRKHIPELQDFGHTITVRHLIHHTSGLREWHALREYAGLQQDDVATEQNFLRLVSRQQELNFPPGAEYSYCNTGYHLLGQIVKRVSGKSLRAFTEEEIFRPLGMNNTYFRDDYRLIIKNGAESYTPRSAKLGGFHRSFLVDGNSGATNLHTTALDLAKWDRNFYDPKVGGQKVIDAMHTKGKLTDGTEIKYAGGLVIDKYRGLKTVEHTGSRAGFRTVLLRFPEERFSVIILANRSDFQTAAVARQIADIYLEDKLMPVTKAEGAGKAAGAKKGKGTGKDVPGKVQLTADEMKELTGDFYSEELDVVYHVLVKDGKLMLRHRKGDTVLTPTSAGKFNCVGGVLTGAVEYLRGADKRFMGLLIGVPSCRNLRFVRVQLGGS